jgi:hypothetical protein
MKTKVAKPKEPISLPRVSMPSFQPTQALEVACRAGSDQDITKAFANATQSWDPQTTFFRVGPNNYTVQGIVGEMRNHSHYGSEFLEALRRKYA